MSEENNLTLAQLWTRRERETSDREIERRPPSGFKSNPPPVSQPMRKALKVQKGPHLEVALFVQVMPDGVAKDDWVMGQTRFEPPGYRFPECRYDQYGAVNHFNGPFEWMGAYKIQSLYSPGVLPTALSCYGRGTTQADINDGNTTLGFHEHCHQLDYLEYLDITSLPELPDLFLGMHVGDYQDEQRRFAIQFKTFNQGMEEYSETRTDEVGYRQSHWKATGRCFNWTPREN